MSIDIIKPASTFRTNLIGLYIAIMAILLAYFVIALFPVRITGDNGDIVWDTTLKFLHYKFQIQSEIRLLLLVMTMGALGSYVHAGTSFISYVGNRGFVKSWTWWYLLRPFIGMALSVVFYFVIRGGLFSAGASASDISPYGFAAVAGLVGMFSKQATDKLEEVFNNLFQVSVETGDHQRIDKLGINRPVTEKMIPLSQITVFRLTKSEDQTKLADIISICRPGITRIPILDNTDRLLYLIHRGLLNEFITGWPGESPATLSDLVKDPSVYTLIYNAIAFISQNATVGDAKAAMDSTSKCQDVIVTFSGQRDEPIIGWLTNIDIGRMASV